MVTNARSCQMEEIVLSYLRFYGGDNNGFRSALRVFEHHEDIISIQVVSDRYVIVYYEDGDYTTIGLEQKPNTHNWMKEGF